MTLELARRVMLALMRPEFYRITVGMVNDSECDDPALAMFRFTPAEMAQAREDREGISHRHSELKYSVSFAESEWTAQLEFLESLELESKTEVSEPA